jgi:predicted phage terminase large subunit-like protein
VLRAQKAVMPPKGWAALYMQSPIADGGNLIQRSWIKNALVPPDLKTCHTYIGFDLATSVNKGDWSAIVTLAVDHAGDYFILDVWRDRTTIDKTIEALLDRCVTYNPVFLCAESGLLANASGPFLRSRMIERGIYKHVELIPARHSKELRASSFIGRASVKSIHLPPLSQRCEWVSDYVAELISFPPASKNDDQLDATAVIFQALDKISPGRAATPKAEPKRLVIGGPGTNICMEDLWAEEERRSSKYRSSGRIR